jgi:hypothetical protein
VRLALAPLAQVGYRYDWAGFWIILGALGAVIGVVVYLWFRSQPPSGPTKLGE